MLVLLLLAPISADDQTVLRCWAGAAKPPAMVAQRAKILLAAEGLANSHIAERFGMSRASPAGSRGCSPALLCRSTGGCIKAERLRRRLGDEASAS